jgi:hypothetical protein
MTIVTIVIPALAPAEMKKHVQGIHR